MNKDAQLKSLLISELLQARMSAELTQIQLANKLSKPQSFVSKYESGERGLSFIEVINICEALSLDIGQLLSKLKLSRPSTSYD